MSSAFFVERAIDVEGREFAYVEAGAGKDTVIVVTGPGRGFATSAWEGLARTRRVLIVEAPEAHSAAEAATLLRENLRAVVDHAYHIIGVSFGATVAALIHESNLSERIGIEVGTQAQTLSLVAPVFAWRGGDRALSAADLFSKSEAHDDELGATALAAENRGLRWWSSLPDRDTAIESLGSLSGLVLIVAGTVTDEFHGVQISDFRGIIPVADLSYVYDTKHAIDIERPASVVHLLSQFVDFRSEYKVTRTSGVLFP